MKNLAEARMLIIVLTIIAFELAVIISRLGNIRMGQTEERAAQAQREYEEGTLPVAFYTPFDTTSMPFIVSPTILLA